MSKYDDKTADAAILQVTPSSIYGMNRNVGSDDIGSWTLANKYEAKKVAKKSLDWFFNHWEESGFHISEEEQKQIKDLWLVAGAPFISWSNPEYVEPKQQPQEPGVPGSFTGGYDPNKLKKDVVERYKASNVTIESDEKLGNYASFSSGGNAYIAIPKTNDPTNDPGKTVGPQAHFYSTSRRLNVETGEITDNQLYPIGAPDIIVINKNNLDGPFALLDELGHALRLSHPNGLPGLNMTEEDDLNTMVLLDTVNKLAKGNPTRDENFPALFNETFTDSVLFSLNQQITGEPWIDYVGDGSQPWMQRYTVISAETGQVLSEEAAAHAFGAETMLLSLADELTGGDGTLTKDDIVQINQSSFGNQLLDRIMNAYGTGSEGDIYYGIHGDEPIEKYEYDTGKEDLVHYNPEILTSDARYELAKKNLDKYLSENVEQYKTTMESLKWWREQTKGD
jgi:hypothetical protein